MTDDNFDPRREVLPTVVRDSTTFEAILERVIYAQKVLASLEKRRKEITSPLWNAYKEKQAEAKEVMEPYENFKEQGLALVNEWVEKVFVQETQHLIEQAIGSALTKRLSAAMVWQPPQFSTPYGRIQIKLAKRLVVTDKSRVSDEYKNIDEKKLTKALELGAVVHGAELVPTFEVVAVSSTAENPADKDG